MGLEGRDPEIYKFGLEEVDVHDLFEGFDEHQIHRIMYSTNALMLSSFCRGNCPECGLNARPYSSANRKIFALNPLVDFLERHPPNTFGDLMLYDASDPLDYPDLLELLDYFNSRERRVCISTSCPPGREGMFRELLKRDKEGKIPFVSFMLSVLPSSRERLGMSGILREALEAGDGLRSPRRFRCIEPRYIGRRRAGGLEDYNDTGFWCGDLMVLTPDDGPCCAEYHIASDKFPTERKLVPIRESRRIYLHDQFFSMTLGDGFLSGPRMYTPHSVYFDIDDLEGKAVKEVSQRHLAAYIFSILSNLVGMKRCTPPLVAHFSEICDAVSKSEFSLSSAPEERVFYAQLIRKLADDLLRALVDSERFLKGRVLMAGDSSFRPEHYRPLVIGIKDLIERYSAQVLGEGGELIKLGD